MGAITAVEPGSIAMFISKSRYLSGLQCEKLLWNQYNARHLIPPPDADTRFIFEQGHEVGRLAQQLVPGGVEIPFGKVATTVAETRRFLSLRRPIYEASFLAGGAYCRVDILRPTADARWDLMEVKSSTQVKDVNLADVALQRHCLQASGLRVERLFLVHIDRDYVRRGPVEPQGLFRVVDVTDRVDELAGSIGPNLERFLAVVEGPEPDVPIGPHCDRPYACDLKPRCWAHLPEHHPKTLSRAGDKGHDWIARGLTHVTDVPEQELTPPQRIQVGAVRAGEAHIDRSVVRRWLDALQYPLVLMDFEAFGSAVPLLQGTSPYQSIPFQASVHLIDHPGAEPRHLEFLATTSDDPRPELVRFLVRLPETGSVVAWHMSYERKILQELAIAHPEQGPTLSGLIDRLVDLEWPFREFAYYHPAQRGRTSIKAVLPALAGTSYDGDAIADGRAAAREYLRAIQGDTPPGEREAILTALRRYCEKDTWAMVEVLRVLEAG